ncbi:MAG: ATP-grasp domain-containing protein [Paludibacteraceae bacterium]|nr:ATP-grasp domain-containing protein [Paludibacteraceae bacterium]
MKKKLLFLGSNYLLAEAVLKAKELGYYTIVTDWNLVENSPAKQVADEHWEISLSDIDTMVTKIKDENVEGVFTNFTDSYLPYYVKICEEAGLPCLANLKQIEMISNKDQSKQMCMDHGISVSKRYYINNQEDIVKLKGIKFPVLTKPVDNSGQRGIFVCHSFDKLEQLYMESLKYSASNNVIIEEYVEGDYVVMCFTIQNGVVTLSTMADKPVTEHFVGNEPRLPKGYVMPSKYIDLCIEKTLPGVQAFVKDMGLQNGVICIEAVVKDNDIFVFEMQFRLGGMRHHNFVLKENGMDIMAMLLNYSFSGKFDGWDAQKFDNPKFKNAYCSLNVLIEPDTAARVEGLDIVKAMPHVTNFTLMMKEGDTVGIAGTVQQIFCKVMMKDDSYEKILEDIRHVLKTIKVYNKEGKNIVMQLW